MVGGLHILMNVLRQTCAVDKTTSILWEEDKMEGIIGTLEFYAPVLALGVIIIGIVYFMKKRNDKK